MGLDRRIDLTPQRRAVARPIEEADRAPAPAPARDLDRAIRRHRGDEEGLLSLLRGLPRSRRVEVRMALCRELGPRQAARLCARVFGPGQGLFPAVPWPSPGEARPASDSRARYDLTRAQAAKEAALALLAAAPAPETAVEFLGALPPHVARASLSLLRRHRAPGQDDQADKAGQAGQPGHPGAALAALDALSRGAAARLAQGHALTPAGPAGPGGPARHGGEALVQASLRRAATLFRRHHDEHHDAAGPDHPDVAAALGGQDRGEPLPEALCRRMEARFGADFGRVRVHTDGTADRAARALRARAFTLGEDIFFEDGTYAPDNHAAEELLAHELTHVVQAQQGRTDPPAAGPRVSHPTEPLEREARSVAARVAGGGQAGLLKGGPPPAANHDRGPAPGGMTLLREDQKEPEPQKGLDAGMLVVKDFKLDAGTGQLARARPSGETVDIESPRITFDATVSLKDGVKIGEGQQIRVGPVQTLLGSQRTGVYRRGGQKDGEVLSEQRSSMDQVRDAQFDPSKSGKAKDVTASAESPFYSQPGSVSDSSKDATLHFMDQPGFQLPMKIGLGVLTEVKGADRFNTSIGAKREGAGVITLHPFTWSVPWDMQVQDGTVRTDDKGASTAKGLGTAEAKEGVVMDTPDDFAVKRANNQRELTTFTSLEAAMAASPETLMQNLVPCKAKAPESAGFIAQALKAKNPAIQVTLAVKGTASLMTADKMVVHAGAARRGPFKLNDGQQTSTTFALNEVINVDELTGGSAIVIAAADEGGTVTNAGGQFSWKYPFWAQDTPVRLKGGEGKYEITVKLG